MPLNLKWKCIEPGLKVHPKCISRRIGWLLNQKQVRNRLLFLCIFYDIRIEGFCQSRLYYLLENSTQNFNKRRLVSKNTHNLIIKIFFCLNIKSVKLFINKMSQNRNKIMWKSGATWLTVFYDLFEHAWFYCFQDQTVAHHWICIRTITDLFVYIFIT